MHRIGICSLLDPIPVIPYTKAIMHRFAHSAPTYFKALREDVRRLAGNFLSLQGLIEYCVPRGGLAERGILCQLLETIDLIGPFQFVRQAANAATGSSHFLLPLCFVAPRACNRPP